MWRGRPPPRRLAVYFRGTASRASMVEMLFPRMTTMPMSTLRFSSTAASSTRFMNWSKPRSVPVTCRLAFRWTARAGRGGVGWCAVAGEGQTRAHGPCGPLQPRPRSQTAWSVLAPQVYAGPPRRRSPNRSEVMAPLTAELLVHKVLQLRRLDLHLHTNYSCTINMEWSSARPSARLRPPQAPAPSRHSGRSRRTSLPQADSSSTRTEQQNIKQLKCIPVSLLAPVSACCRQATQLARGARQQEISPGRTPLPRQVMRASQLRSHLAPAHRCRTCGPSAHMPWTCCFLKGRGMFLPFPWHWGWNHGDRREKGPGGREGEGGMAWHRALYSPWADVFLPSITIQKLHSALTCSR